MTKEIALTKGKIALVDDGDYPWLIRQFWYFDGRYAAGSTYHSELFKAGEKVWTKRLYMHRYILNAADADVVDHIDGDKLNNTRANLRLCTQRQNAWNSGPHQDGQSGYRGVAWNKRRQYWEAKITNTGRTIYLGAFASEEEAASAYDVAALQYRGAYARLNFAESAERPREHTRIPLNKHNARPGASSKYPGVSWRKDRNVWRASITVNGHVHFLGSFQDELDAANAYTEALARLCSDASVNEHEQPAIAEALYD